MLLETSFSQSEVNKCQPRLGEYCPTWMNQGDCHRAGKASFFYLQNTFLESDLDVAELARKFHLFLSLLTEGYRCKMNNSLNNIRVEVAS